MRFAQGFTRSGSAGAGGQQFRPPYNPDIMQGYNDGDDSVKHQNRNQEDPREGASILFRLELYGGYTGGGRIDLVFKNKEGEGEEEDENEEPPAQAKPLKRYKRKAGPRTTEEFLAKQAESFLVKAKDIREFYEEWIPDRGARVWCDGIPVRNNSDAETFTIDPRLVDLPASTIAPRERVPKEMEMAVRGVQHLKQQFVLEAEKEQYPPDIYAAGAFKLF
ncbi:hypothetical protein B0H14DRAFT_2611498 [Mycena olivaceomarginata]|nr:hypothetical protein B0H14DRAFT_2611498 [Mycena olivaceomarginata]